MRDSLYTLAMGSKRYFILALGNSGPSDDEWAHNMRALTDYRRLQGGDMTTLRLVIITDGAMPDTPKRVELQALLDYAVPIAVVSDNGDARALVTVMRWSNSNACAFMPAEGQKLCKHLGLSLPDMRTLFIPALRTLPPGRSLSALINELSTQQGATQRH